MVIIPEGELLVAEVTAEVDVPGRLDDASVVGGAVVGVDGSELSGVPAPDSVVVSVPAAVDSVGTCEVESTTELTVVSDAGGCSASVGTATAGNSGSAEYGTALAVSDPATTTGISVRGVVDRRESI